MLQFVLHKSTKEINYHNAPSYMYSVKHVEDYILGCRSRSDSYTLHAGNQSSNETPLWPAVVRLRDALTAWMCLHGIMKI